MEGGSIFALRKVSEIEEGTFCEFVDGYIAEPDIKRPITLVIEAVKAEVAKVAV